MSKKAKSVNRKKKERNRRKKEYPCQFLYFPFLFYLHFFHRGFCLRCRGYALEKEENEMKKIFPTHTKDNLRHHPRFPKKLQGKRVKR